MQSKDEKYMKEAIRQAKKAYGIGEVPIGCVIVYEDKIIGRGYRRTCKAFFKLVIDGGGPSSLWVVPSLGW